MAYRAPVQPGFEETKLQTTAAPVDTYVRPAESPAQQLVKALSEVDPTVQQFTQDWASRTEAEQKQAGIEQARRLAAHVQAQGDAVRSGDLPMQDSAWFQAGLQEESGRISAGNFNSYFTANVAPKLDGAMSLADFDNAWAQAQAAYREQNGAGDEFFQKGQSGYMEQYRQEQRLKFAQDLEGKFAKKAIEVIHDRTMQTVEDDARAGVSIHVTEGALEHLVQSKIISGVPERIARTAVAQAIVDYAKQQEDPAQGRQALKELFHTVKGEGGTTLARSATGAAMLEKADNELRDLQWGIERHDHEQEQQARQESLQNDMDKMGQQAMKSPLGISQKWISENIAPENQGEAQKMAAALKQANVSRFTPDNPIAYGKLVARIFEPEKYGDISSSDINNAIGQTISGPEGITLHNLMAAKAKGGDYETLQKLPGFKEMFNDVHTIFANQMGAFDAPSNALAAQIAEGNFLARAMNDLKNGTIKPGTDTTAYFQKMGAEVMRQDYGGLTAKMRENIVRGGASGKGAIVPGPIDPNNPSLGNYSVGAPAAEAPKPEEQKKVTKTIGSTVQSATIYLHPDEIDAALRHEPAAMLKARAEAARLGLPTDGASVLTFVLAAQAKNRTK